MNFLFNSKYRTLSLLCFAVLVPGLTSSASADAIPSGWTCSGSCGSLGADGVVTLSPTGNSSYQYITTDGAGFADYAWAELYSSTNNPVALLFTARTEQTGSIVPGTGLPSPTATLNPTSVPIIPGGPVWSPLGASSGQCFDVGCGY